MAVFVRHESWIGYSCTSFRFSIMLVALALAPALAPALEFPGKSRLNRDAYIMVQPIY
jgi:hypothetical protein